MRLKRIWQDIQHGENIDLYVTVIAAIVLAFLNVFGVTASTWVAPLIPAILALLAISILGNRHRLEMLLETSSGMTRQPFIEEFPPELSSDLAKARDVWILGVHSRDVMGRYYSLFQEKVERGDRFHILFLDPNGAAAAMTAMRIPGNNDPNQERSLITSSLNIACKLKELAPDQVEIRTIDYLFGYGGLILDPDSSWGVVYIQRYTFKKFGGSRKPKSIYRRKDGNWYELICFELKEFWKIATPWNC